MTGHGGTHIEERIGLGQLEKLRALYRSPLMDKLSAPQNIKRNRLDTIEHTFNNALCSLESFLLTDGSHALHEELICGLPIQEFKKSLQFFDADINTSLLYYASCFAGGNYLVAPYKKEEKDLQLSYDIIVGCASDAVATLKEPAYTSGTLARNEPESIQYKECINYLKKPNRDPFTIAQLMHPYVENNGHLLQDDIENIAHFRPAGATEFTVLANTNCFFIPTRKSTLIPTKTSVLFFLDTYYPNLFIIGDSFFPNIISLIPGAAYHKIANIYAPDVSPENILKAFLTLPTLSSPKLYWIDRLECKNNRYLTNTLPYDLVQENENGNTVVFHDLIIARNIITSDGIKHGTSSGAYCSNKSGKTWYCPFLSDSDINRPVLYKTNGKLAHQELLSIFSSTASG